MTEEFAKQLVAELNRRIEGLDSIEIETISALEHHRDAILIVMKNMGHEIEK